MSDSADAPVVTVGASYLLKPDYCQKWLVPATRAEFDRHAAQSAQWYSDWRADRT